jgi:flagellin-like protein
MGRGQTGIGALIVFIAFVLTAAIAAFLVTQTTVSTQSKAAAVADQARERTGTTFEIIRVEGIANVSTQTIDRYLIYVRLAPGSSPVNLNTTALAYYTADGRAVYLLGGNVDNETSLPKTSDEKFYIVNRLSAAKESPPDQIFEPGEMYVLGVVVNNTIKPSDWWRFTLIPKEGQPAEVYGVAPDVFTSNVTILR